MSKDNTLFYDNVSCKYDEHGRRFIDRIYRFAWEAFTEDDWEELGKAYRALPSWLGYATSGYSHGCPT